MASDAPFARALDAAITARGLSLERLAVRLQAAGVPVSRATLSYWRSGRSEPGRAASMLTLAMLESILRVEPDSLASLVAPPKPRGRAARAVVDAAGPARSQLLPADRVEQLLAELGFEEGEQLVRTLVHDRVHINSQRNCRLQEVRFVLRAVRDGSDRFPVVHWVNFPEHTMPQVEAISGCTVGRVLRDAQMNVETCEMLLPRPLAKDEYTVVQYAALLGRGASVTTSVTRALRTTGNPVILEVQFDPTTLPTRVFTWRRRPDGQGEDDTGEVLLNGTLAQAVLYNEPPGVIGLRWDWD